jgi:hypothetical protein
VKTPSSNLSTQKPTNQPNKTQSPQNRTTTTTTKRVTGFWGQINLRVLACFFMFLYPTMDMNKFMTGNSALKAYVF